MPVETGVLFKMLLLGDLSSVTDHHYNPFQRTCNVLGPIQPGGGGERKCKKPFLAKQPLVGTPMRFQGPVCPQARSQGCAQGEEWDVGQHSRSPPSSCTCGFLAGSIVGDLLGCFAFFFFIFACIRALRTCSSQKAKGQGQEAQLLLVCGQLEAAPSEVPERSVLTQHLRAEGEAHAARWDKPCAGSTGIWSSRWWLGCVIWDTAIAFPRHD